MRSFDLSPDELVEIEDDDAVAAITGGVSPWMSTMRLATHWGGDRAADANTLVHLQGGFRPW
ncbi:MAG TPA: hypothetical protein H9987_06015 [Candidatus Luteococcus avicola]|nr:hypothetical protein [Candidatus Luteococcus avicola]